MKLRITTYLRAPGCLDPTHLLLTPPPGPPAASSLALGRHGGPGAGGGEHLSRERQAARRHEDRPEPFGGVDGGSNPTLHTVSCQEEAGHEEKLQTEHRPR